jgi:predicted acylesterase/phospholipase RssA
VKALVLTGGAARGVYAAGVVEALLAGETFDIVCGSSIGALNGLAVALDRTDLSRELWSRIAAAGVLRLAEPLASLAGLRRAALGLGNGRLPARLRSIRRLAANLPALLRLGTLRKLLGAFDQGPLRAILAPHCAVANLRRTLLIGATNLTHSRNDTFFAFPGDANTRADAYRALAPDAHRLTDANLLDVLCASSALPGAFAPVSIELDDGTRALFADGGIANNAPIQQAIDAGAIEVTVILLQHSGLRYRDRAIRSLADVGFVMHDIVQEHILELELRFVRAVNEAVLLGTARRGQRFIDLRVIGPSVPLRLSSLSFDDQASIDRVYNLGVTDGQAARSVRH